MRRPHRQPGTGQHHDRTEQDEDQLAGRPAGPRHRRGEHRLDPPAGLLDP
ncbi:hypothetical protein [Solwaraspora sp. WMMA2101]